MGLSESMPILPLLEAWGFHDVQPDRGWHTVTCVIHGDRHKSGRANTIENAYKCQACDAKGDTLSLIMQQRRLDVAGAIRYYEGLAGIEVPKVSGKSSGKPSPRIPSGGKASYERGYSPLQAGVQRRRPGGGRPRV